MNQNPNDSLHCGICYRRYTPQIVPVSLPQCGHSLCKECSETILSIHQGIPSCPFCKKHFLVLQGGAYLQPQINYALLSTFQDSYLFGICEQHRLPYEYLCGNDRQYVCAKCCIIGKHQGHQNMELEVIKKECDTKLKSLEDAHKDLKESLPKMQSLLDKRQHEALKTTDGCFDKMESIIKKQRQEWKAKITQIYTKEKERLSFQATMNNSVEKALEKKLEEYKVITPQRLFYIKEEDLEEFLKKCGKEALAENIKTYCSDLSQFSEQLNKSLIDQSVNLPVVQFPDTKLAVNDMSFPLGLSPVNSESCLWFEMVENTLSIGIRRNQGSLNFNNIKSWEVIKKISLNVENIWISDSDYELLKTFLNNLSQVHSIHVEFGPQLVEPHGLTYNFQKEIANLMRLFFPNLAQLTSIGLIWNSSRGGQIALDYLVRHVLSHIPQLEDLEVNLPNIRLDGIAFKNLIGAFPSFKENLQSLSITVQGFSSDYDWANMHLNFPKLNKLSFRILKDNISQRGFASRFKDMLLVNLNFLSQLDIILSFSSKEIEKGLLELVEALQKKNTLKELAIIVSNLVFTHDNQGKAKSKEGKDEPKISFKVVPTDCFGVVVNPISKLKSLEKLCIGSSLEDCQTAMNRNQIKEMLNKLKANK